MTTETETPTFAYCDGDACWPTRGNDGYSVVIGPHSPLALVAGDDPETMMQAIQDSEGYRVTNRRADGVIDTTGLEDAEADESPACLCCSSFVGRWVHPEAA